MFVIPVKTGSADSKFQKRERRRPCRTVSGSPLSVRDVKTNSLRGRNWAPDLKCTAQYETNAAVVSGSVDYLDYRERGIRDRKRGDEDGFFEGLIHYIYFKSGNQYNTTELRIGYRNRNPNSDPANILDSTTPTLFESGDSFGEFLMIEFPRIKVRPVAYAFRTGPHSLGGPHLNSFVFQAHDADGRWVTLDERHNPYTFHQHYAARICYVDTECYFSVFRLKVVRGGSFALCAFEIHGGIQPRDDCVTQGNDIRSLDDEAGEFDPWSLPDWE